TDEKDSDWGFEQGGREKVIEPKLGIALAVCLLLVFGFVVYQKYQTLSGGILQAAAEGSAPTEPDVSGAASESSDFANKAADREEFYPPSDSAISSAVPRGQSSVSDPFASREPTSADPWQEQEAAPSSGHA